MYCVILRLDGFLRFDKCSADASSKLQKSVLRRVTAGVGSLWSDCTRCSDVLLLQINLFQLLFGGNFLWCLALSYSKHSVFGYKVRDHVMFSKLSLS